MAIVNCCWPSPPATPALAARDVHMWCASLDLSVAAGAAFHDTLSPDEQQRAARFRAGPMRDRFVAGRGILRAILAKYLGVSAVQLALQYGPRGKPALAAPWDRSGLGFNVSHSHGLALFAISSGRPLGVDVEWPHPISHMAGMVERFFSAAEQREWQALAVEDQPGGFFRGWTCKEAWLKATGTGLAFPLGQVSVSLSPHEPPRLLAIGTDREEAGGWHLECVTPAVGYVAALAVRGEPPRVTAWRWT